MKGKKLRSEILRVIHDKWPIHVSGVIEHLGLDTENITNVSKIRYHFNKLENKEVIHTKKIGRALVAWPVHIEKMRIIHEMIRTEEVE